MNSKQSSTRFDLFPNDPVGQPANIIGDLLIAAAPMERLAHPT
jgi:hypothetical protein